MRRRSRQQLHVQRRDDDRDEAASPISQIGATSAPIFRLSAVNITSGTTAKGSCRLRITCVRIRSCAVPLSPYQIVTAAAGTIAMPRVISRRSQGGRRMLEEALHHDLAGERRGHRRVEAAAEQRDAEQASARWRAPSSGASRLCASPSSATSVRPVRVEGRGGEDQDRGVDQEREHQRDGRVDGRELQRLALLGQRVAVGAGLHDAPSAGRDCAASRSRR